MGKADCYVMLMDYNQFLSSYACTYFHILACALVPPLEGGIACGQVHMINMWFFSGIAKESPWYSCTNGPFMSTGVLFRGQKWFFDMAFRGDEDLSPPGV